MKIKQEKSQSPTQNTASLETSATPEVQEIVKRVLQLEKDKLYLKNPRYINDDVLQIVKEVVQ